MHLVAQFTAIQAPEDLLPCYFRFARAFSPRFLGANEARVAPKLLVYVCFSEPSTSSCLHLQSTSTC